MDLIEPSNLKGDIGSPSAPKSDGNDYSNSTTGEKISMWLVQLSSTPELVSVWSGVSVKYTDPVYVSSVAHGSAALVSTSLEGHPNRVSNGLN